jgi:ApbE family
MLEADLGALDAACSRFRPDSELSRLSDATRTMTVPEGVRLDVGSTAKAWAADQAAARLAAALGCGVLDSLGGDISVTAAPPPSGWLIRVQDVTGGPAAPAPGSAVLVAIGGGGLATSSTAARRWRRGAAVLHHILDPRSGRPAPVWRIVSVAAATTLDANIASTAAIIRGQAAMGWLSGPGPAARQCSGRPFLDGPRTRHPGRRESVQRLAPTILIACHRGPIRAAECRRSTFRTTVR